MCPSCQPLHCPRNPSLFRPTAPIPSGTKSWRRKFSPVAERSCRTCSFTFSGLLQPAFCGDESLGVVETSDRFVHPQSESPQDSLQDGNSPVGSPVREGQRLDGVSGLEGRLLASPSPSGQSHVPQICGLESGLSVQGSLFWSPRLRKFSHGSWLWFRLFCIIWVSGYVVI